METTHIQNLRCGWSTGACASAATKSACHALLLGSFLEPVTLSLPNGKSPQFVPHLQQKGSQWARVGIIKDAGDDPDVTHGALIIATVRRAPHGNGIRFRAGEGVGTVTKHGLPILPGEPAINPVPRLWMRTIVTDLTNACGIPPDIEIEISVPNGVRIAQKTLNPRLGILGGISILGTTGIVRPFSCSAWIHGIQQGIDVARAAQIQHIAGATGTTSEAAVRTVFGLPEIALIDMGDFVGGMIKHIRKNPVKRISIAGGFGKMSKLAHGHLDLHSKRSSIPFTWLSERAATLGAPSHITHKIRHANTTAEVLDLCRTSSLPLPTDISLHAHSVLKRALRNDAIRVDILIVDREGDILAQT